MLAVMLLHSGVLPFGWMGVDLFFALSGFLITGIVLDAKGQGSVLAPFYARRALRIFPLAYASLVVAFLIVPVFRPELHAPASSQALWWLYLSNLRAGAPGVLVYLRHFWSLAVEEQFYLVWPVVVLSLGGRSLRRLCVALVGVAIVTRCALVVLRIPRLDPELFTLARLDGLVAGAFLASLMRESSGQIPVQLRVQLRRVAFFGAMAVLGIIIAQRTASSSGLPMRTVGLSVVGVTAAAVVGLVALEPPAFLAASWLRWLGTISYGLYVTHAPIALVLASRIPPLLLPVAVVAVSTVLAAASWYLYESPILSLKRFVPMTARPDAKTEP